MLMSLFLHVHLTEGNLTVRVMDINSKWKIVIFKEKKYIEIQQPFLASHADPTCPILKTLNYRLYIKSFFSPFRYSPRLKFCNATCRLDTLCNLRLYN